LQVVNTNTAAGSKALQLNVTQNQPPLAVNATADKATNLNADKLDGQDASALFAGGTYEVEQSATIGVNDSALLEPSCDQGDVALSGGFRSVDSVRIANSARNRTRSWSVFAVNPANASDGLVAQTVCADFGAPHQQ
jgi:hypothetical protein